MSLEEDRDKLLERFMNSIGYRFERVELLDQALTHSSVKEDGSLERRDNERLEFFGDAVLNFIVTKKLMHRYREEGEGSLTQRRIELVRNDNLENIGHQLNITDHMAMGGSIARNAQKPKGMASGAVEALIAALFIDGGECDAAAFVERFVMKATD